MLGHMNIAMWLAREKMVQEVKAHNAFVVDMELHGGRQHVGKVDGHNMRGHWKEKKNNDKLIYAFNDLKEDSYEAFVSQF